mmetsp:Transcript_11772/g.30267  ORF Transcript_11772/g.30267 Transcript_11772/m.30267 type:complete len:126 (-) Transcript_11772:312-689(-)
MFMSAACLALRLGSLSDSQTRFQAFVDGAGVEGRVVSLQARVDDIRPSLTVSTDQYQLSHMGVTDHAHEKAFEFQGTIHPCSFRQGPFKSPQRIVAQVVLLEPLHSWKWPSHRLVMIAIPFAPCW